jgi:hypothetical protein
MCENCRNERFDRGDILKFSAAAAVALGLSAASRAAACRGRADRGPPLTKRWMR